MMVFICHSKIDIAYVERLVDVLERTGYDCWYCERDNMGNPIGKAVDEALLKSDCAIFVMTGKVSEISDYVQNEINYFIQAKKKIIPLRVNMHANWYPNGSRSLIQAIPVIDDIDGTIGCVVEEEIVRVLGGRGKGVTGGRNRPLHLPDDYSAKEIFANDFLTRLVSTDAAAEAATRRFKDTRQNDTQCSAQTHNTISSQRRTNVDSAVSSKKEAYRLYSQGKYKQVIHFFFFFFLRGDVEAQRMLAAMYFNGQGVKKSDAEALKWVRKAAKQGDAWAKSSLEAHSFRYKIRELMESDAFAYFWVVVFFVLVIGIIATFVWSRFF